MTDAVKGLHRVEEGVTKSDEKTTLDRVAMEDFTLQETLNGNIKTLMVRRRSHRRT